MPGLSPELEPTASQYAISQVFDGYLYAMIPWMFPGASTPPCYQETRVNKSLPSETLLLVKSRGL